MTAEVSCVIPLISTNHQVPRTFQCVVGIFVEAVKFSNDLQADLNVICNTCIHVCTTCGTRISLTRAVNNVNGKQVLPLAHIRIVQSQHELTQ